MSTQEIVPTITVDKVGCLTVDSNILLYVTFHTLTGVRIDLDDADKAEICSIASPQTTRCRIEQQTRVDGVSILQTVGSCYLDCLRILEIRRLRIECLVPHGKDTTVMAATQTTTCGTVDHQIAITDLEHIRSSTATGTLCARVPCPTVLRDQTATTCSKSIVFSVTLCDCRRVVDIGTTDLCLCALCQQQGCRHGHRGPELHP